MGLFSQLKEGLAKTRQRLSQGLDTLIGERRTVNQEVLEELEELLLGCDLGVKTTFPLLERVRQEASTREGENISFIKEQIKSHLFDILAGNTGSLIEPAEKPMIIMMVGVNGGGKTTTIAKLAHHFLLQKKRVVLAAADTFRAAAIEQLEHWGKILNVEVVKQGPGADPAAVAFDAARRAEAKGCDVMIADTAGRLHTKANLMEELKKMRRVLAKEVKGSPHEILLVIDATCGQNGLEQAKTFHHALGITGIALAKLDGTAKGGIVVAIAAELGVPIKFVGLGEKIEDLRVFDPKEFVEALF
ncbi:MAG: signal recognition particle-docking protein FtsY [Thermodesulfobacteriota bacterium]